jgi:hypothetical protein
MPASPAIPPQKSGSGAKLSGPIGKKIFNQSAKRATKRFAKEAS